MPFWFVVGGPSPVARGDRYYVSDITLGYDTDTDERVLMSVALLEADDGGDPHELVFGIRLENLRTWEITAFDFDQATGRKYIQGRGAADLVMYLVLSAIRPLVNHSNAKTIVMESFHPNLPAKAMGKYARISSELKRCGLKLKDHWRDGTDGKDYWLFTR